MCTVDKNPATRIWLTTEECLGFYPSLAGLCLKLAYEPPEGVKRNVKRSLQQLQQKQQDTVNVPGSVLLSWLHATLQERRKFVPQGWIRPYEWNESDLEAAYELVVKETGLKKGKDKDGSWQTGRGLLDVAIYGGRLQDDYDMRALCSMISDVWSLEVFEGRRKLAGVLMVPDSSLENAVKALEQLPDNDSPKECFGLPANAHRAWERAAAEAALSHLKGSLLLVGVIWVDLNRELRRFQGRRGELRGEFLTSSRSLFAGVLIKVSSGDDRISKKLESKIQRDLKELIDRSSSIFGSAGRAESGRGKNPLERFFADEMNLTRKTLNVVRMESDAICFEDSKVGVNSLTYRNDHCDKRGRCGNDLSVIDRLRDTGWTSGNSGPKRFCLS